MQWSAFICYNKMLNAVEARLEVGVGNGAHHRTLDRALQTWITPSLLPQSIGTCPGDEDRNMIRSVFCPTSALMLLSRS